MHSLQRRFSREGCNCNDWSLFLWNPDGNPYCTCNERDDVQRRTCSVCYGASELSYAGSKNVGQLLWEKAKDFLQRAFTVIFGATIVIWFLQSFDLHLNMVTDSQASILATVAGMIAPVFIPLGFGDWRISTALISGFMAKESVVSTLSILFGSTAALTAVINTAGAAALLIFCLLYTPCVAAIASIKRELGGKWAIGVVIFQCVIAWVAAFIVHGIVCLF